MNAQDGLGRRDPVQETSCRVGKVVSVHRSSNSVDVAPLDGPMLRDVPVLSWSAGSTFGAVGLMAPSYDGKVPARKTFPAPADGADVVEPKANLLAGKSRDVYCVFTQVGGDAVGRSGHVVLGFLYPMVSEMLFGADQEDLFLFRHGSDFQMTVEKDGKFSLRHPSGSRFTVGVDDGDVELGGKDFDKLYALAHNLVPPAKVYITDVFSFVELDAVGNIQATAPISIKMDAGVSIDGTAGTSISFTAGATISCYAGASFSAYAGATATVAGGATGTFAGGAIASLLAGGIAKVTSKGIVSVQGALILIGGGGGTETAEDVEFVQAPA